MKNNLSVFALVAAFAALGISIYHPVNRGVGALQSEAKKETTYERVMRTRTIRCGYFVWPPFLTKDLNTGALSGLNYDVAEEMGKLLDLKIEWSQ